MDAKTVVFAAVALVMGLVIGGLGPRSQVRALEAELETRPLVECDRQSGRQIADVFRGQPWRTEAPAFEEERPEPEVELAEEDAGEDDIEIVAMDDDVPVEPTVDELMENAKDVMAIRRAAAEAAFEEQAQPTAEQRQAFDNIMETMNDDLMVIAEDFVATVEQGGEPDRRMSMELAAETLDVLLGAEDQLRESLSSDQVNALDEQSLDPTSYIDERIVSLFEGLDR